MVHDSHEWLHSMYGNIEEEVAVDILTPLGRIIPTSSFIDAKSLS